MILSVASIAVKIIGAIYKIPLARWIGTTGMNYYTDAYQIYSLLFILSTAGVPVAIAKMVSESLVDRRLKEPKKILKISTGIFATIGIILSALLIIFVEPLSKLLFSETANHCLTLIAPSIFLVSVSSTIKGYFQGYKCMTPTAVFQTIEASFKLFGLVAVFIMMRQGITDPVTLACGGILGVTFGSFAAAVFMVIRYFSEKDLGRGITNTLPSHSGRSIAKLVLTLAIPISLSNAVMSVTSTLDMILVKWNLSEYGLDAEAVKDVYGAYTGATGSLFNLPPTITLTFGVAVLPFLTSALAAGKKEEADKNMRSSSKMVSLIAMPCALGMSVMSEPIIKVLYTEGFYEVGIPCMQALAISIFFVAFVSLTGVFLQAAGKVKTSLLTMGIGAVMKLTVNILAVRNIGIIGAPLGTFACYGTITALNIFFIYKYCKFRFPVKGTFLKPFACTALCCAAAYGVWKLLCATGMSLKLALFPALAVAVVVYAATVLLFKVLTKEDLIFLPKQIGSFLEQKGWVHE